MSSACDDVLDREVEAVFKALGEAEVGGGLLDLGGVRVGQATVRQIHVLPETVIVDVVDEYEGGTTASNAQAEIELYVDGIMTKSDAIAAEASGLVVIIDYDLNRHDALVSIIAAIPAQVDFEAIATAEVESVEELRLVGGTLLV